ncbi:hypothetical protein J6590_041303 [Homalodisca vitripennis]|nr:hypothetical protein J6590_041303 [Homalodisca vitripennis]
MIVGDELSIDDSEWADQCPSHIRLFPASVRHPLRNMVKGSCPRSVDAKPRKLTASQFQTIFCKFCEVMSQINPQTGRQ